MSNVINFAAVVNARRAAAKIDLNEKAKAARLEQERQDIADRLGGTDGAQIIADVVMDLKAKEREASAPKYMPAYCDPNNETRGAKHDATKGMRVVDVAKRVREDIKALKLVKGIKVSVRSDYNSIDIRVTGLPSDFPVMSEKAASWRKQFGDRADYPFAWVEARSDELRALLDSLKAIHGAYNRDNSDSSVDYFDTRYYGTADLDWQVQREHEAREVAASPGTYWAEDCVKAY